METLADGGRCLNVAGGSSLSDILEKGPIPPRFFLSAKAAAGILRRAEKRGKKLPEALEQALRAVVELTARGGVSPER